MEINLIGIPAAESTPDDLKPYEKAARLYCEMKGDAPDQIVIVRLRGKYPNQRTGKIEDIELERPLWELAAEKLLDISRCLVALRKSQESESTTDARKTN